MPDDHLVVDGLGARRGASVMADGSLRDRSASPEARAGEALIRFRGGDYEVVDCGQHGEGRHDVEVRTPDGRVLAVEVTRVVDEASRALSAAVEKRDWRSSELTYNWSLTCRRWTRIKSLHAELETPLRVIERHGVRQFLRSNHPRPGSVADEWRVRADVEIDLNDVPSLSRALASLHDLGVRNGVRLDRSCDGVAEVVVTETGDVGATGLSVLREVVLEEAAKPDNWKKLERAAADERHLFIWLGLDEVQIWAALEWFVAGPHPMLEPPELPEHLDVAWLALDGTTDEDELASRILRVDRTGWRYLGAV